MKESRERRDRPVQPVPFVQPGKAVEPADKLSLFEVDEEAAGTILRSSRSPEQKLRELVEAGGFGIAPACRDRALQLAYIVDFDRLVECALAQLAAAQPTGDWGPWLLARIDRAIEFVLREDRELLRSGRNEPGYYRVLVDVAGVGPELALGAAVRFNGLGRATREAFFEALVLPRGAKSGSSRTEPGELLLRLEVAVRAIRCEPNSDRIRSVSLEGRE